MAEKSFADYVQDLMATLPQVNGNPMLSVTSMTDDNARYREDPFYKSRDIQARDQLILDEEERKRREADLSGSGMMTSGEGGGDGSGGRNYYQDLEDRMTELNISEDGMSPEDARAAALNSAFQIQSANNQKYITDPLNALANFSISGLFSKAIGGSPLGQRPANVTIDINAIARAQQEQAAAQRAAEINAQAQARIQRQGSSSSGNSHDAGITGGNSFGGNNADGGGYNE